MKVKDLRNIVNAAWLEANLNHKHNYSDETRKNIALLHVYLFTDCEEQEEIEIKILDHETIYNR